MTTALAKTGRDTCSTPAHTSDSTLDLRRDRDGTTKLDLRDKPHTTIDLGGIFVPGIAKAIEVKIASEREEWEQALGLVAANYRAKGYEVVSNKRFRFTPYHALRDTAVFVAKHEGQVVTTFSLVPDNTLLGLPMESIYGAEIHERRLQGKRMAEVTSLADSGLGVREFLQVFTTIIKLMFQYHVRHGGDTWVITVNPRHRNFYTKVLGFQPLGPCRAYASVQDAPAEAYLLDRDTMRVKAPKMFDDIFGEDLPPRALRKPSMSPELVRQFAADSTQTDPRQVQDVLSYAAHYGSPRRW
jgi:hypothetical protein